MKIRVVLFCIIAIGWSLSPASRVAAQTPCGSAAAPLCDGACSPGEDCEEQSGVCLCRTNAAPCGIDAGPPLCYGECPPATPVCIDSGAGCVCAIPTLSEWGVISMAFLMFGGVLFMRRGWQRV